MFSIWCSRLETTQRQQFYTGTHSHATAKCELNFLHKQNTNEGMNTLNQVSRTLIGGTNRKRMPVNKTNEETTSTPPNYKSFDFSVRINHSGNEIKNYREKSKQNAQRGRNVERMARIHSILLAFNKPNEK